MEFNWAIKGLRDDPQEDKNGKKSQRPLRN